MSEAMCASNVAIGSGQWADVSVESSLRCSEGGFVDDFDGDEPEIPLGGSANSHGKSRSSARGLGAKRLEPRNPAADPNATAEAVLRGSPSGLER